MSFEVKADTFTTEYEYTITPTIKDSVTELNLELKSYITYNSMMAKSVNKLIGCAFDARQ